MMKSALVLFVGASAVAGDCTLMNSECTADADCTTLFPGVSTYCSINGYPRVCKQTPSVGDFCNDVQKCDDDAKAGALDCVKGARETGNKCGITGTAAAKLVTSPTKGCVCETSADCWGNTYCSPNFGDTYGTFVCMPSKMKGEFCNVVQECEQGTQCTSGKCVAYTNSPTVTTGTPTSDTPTESPTVSKAPTVTAKVV